MLSGASSDTLLAGEELNAKLSIDNYVDRIVREIGLSAVEIRGRVSAPVVATNEELMIAQHCLKVLEAGGGLNTRFAATS